MVEPTLREVERQTEVYTRQLKRIAARLTDEEDLNAIDAGRSALEAMLKIQMELRDVIMAPVVEQQRQKGYAIETQASTNPV